MHAAAYREGGNYEEIERNPGFSRRMLAGMNRRLHGRIAGVDALSLRYIERLRAWEG